MSRVKDIKEHIGEKHNMLLVLDCFHGKPHTNGRMPIKALVQCDCGQVMETYYESLAINRRISCGCHRKKHENSAKAKAYREYKYSAKKRGYEFNLSQDEFSRIVEQPCHYCGQTPMRNTEMTGDLYNHNGIDRIDNAIGYTIENCVPCCTTCNHAKMDMSYDNFIDWINKLIKFRS